MFPLGLYDRRVHPSIWLRPARLILAFQPRLPKLLVESAPIPNGILADPALAADDFRRYAFLKVQLYQLQPKIRRVDTARFGLRQRLLAAGRASPPRGRVGLMLYLLGLVYRCHR